MMKKFIYSLLVVTLIFSSIPAKALENNQNVIIEYLNDGSYFETLIEECSTYTMNTKTASKTATYKNADGDSLWSVKVTGTFKYDGNTSECTSASVSTTIYNTSWKVSEKNSYIAGKIAGAKAVMKNYFLGVCIDTVTKTVYLSCAKDGVLS